MNVYERSEDDFVCAEIQRFLTRSFPGHTLNKHVCWPHKVKLLTCKMNDVNEIVSNLHVMQNGA